MPVEIRPIRQWQEYLEDFCGDRDCCCRCCRARLLQHAGTVRKVRLVGSCVAMINLGNVHRFPRVYAGQPYNNMPMYNHPPEK